MPVSATRSTTSSPSSGRRSRRSRPRGCSEPRCRSGSDQQREVLLGPADESLAFGHDPQRHARALGRVLRGAVPRRGPSLPARRRPPGSPGLSRERSSRSATIRERRTASPSSWEANRATAGGSSSAAWRSVSAVAWIVAAGVLSSWDALATKSRRRPPADAARSRREPRRGRALLGGRDRGAEPSRRDAVSSTIGRLALPPDIDDRGRSASGQHASTRAGSRKHPTSLVRERDPSVPVGQQDPVGRRREDQLMDPGPSSSPPRPSKVRRRRRGLPSLRAGGRGPPEPSRARDDGHGRRHELPPRPRVHAASVGRLPAFICRSVPSHSIATCVLRDRRMGLPVRLSRSPPVHFEATGEGPGPHSLPPVRPPNGREACGRGSGCSRVIVMVAALALVADCRGGG